MIMVPMRSIEDRHLAIPMILRTILVLSLVTFLHGIQAFPDYHEEALKLARSGDTLSSLKYFKKYLQNQSHSSASWCNFALASERSVKQLEKRFKESDDKELYSKRIRILMREALVASDIGMLLNPSDTGCIENRHVVETNMKRLFPEECVFSCKRSHQTGEDIIDRALQYWLTNDHQRSINTLCTKEMTTVSLSLDDSDDSKDRISSLSLRRVLLLFRVCGAVKMKSLFPVEIIEELRESVEILSDQYLSDISNDPKLTNSSFSGQRSPLRYEVHLPLTSPFTEEKFIAHSSLLQIVRTMLTNKVEIDTFSFIVSTPGAPNQHWHKDCPDLYSETNLHLPSHGLVLFVPTQDVPKELGPTEFELGSHLHLKGGNVVMDAGIGDCVLFDLRVAHRGTANTSNRNRNSLYISYVREWYRDPVNFRELQTSWIDEVSDRQRKLFSRLDSKKYPLRLEERLAVLEDVYEEIKSRNFYENSGMQFDVI